MDLKRNYTYMYLVLVILVLVFTVRPLIFGDSEVNNFEDCIAAGNPAMESYPRQCRHGDQTFVEEVEGRVYRCTEDQRNVDACIEIYRPVCATVNVQCITAPCDPVQETYSNSCKACVNELVESYVDGEC